MHFFIICDSKASKSGRKLVMLCRKAKYAQGKGCSAQFFTTPLGYFCHPLKITLPPPERNPETTPDSVGSEMAGSVF